MIEDSHRGLSLGRVEDRSGSPTRRIQGAILAAFGLELPHSTRSDPGFERPGDALEAQGLAVGRVREASVFQLAHQLACGRAVLVVMESGVVESTGGALGDLVRSVDQDATDPVVLSFALRPELSGEAHVELVGPDGKFVGEGIAMGPFLEIWSGFRFSMVHTQTAYPAQHPAMAHFPHDLGHLPWIGEAPYELVHGLSALVDPNLGKSIFQAVRTEFLALANGLPVDICNFFDLRAFAGREQVKRLFSRYPGRIRRRPVVFDERDGTDSDKSVYPAQEPYERLG